MDDRLVVDVSEKLRCPTQLDLVFGRDGLSVYAWGLDVLAGRNFDCWVLSVEIHRLKQELIETIRNLLLELIKLFDFLLKAYERDKIVLLRSVDELFEFEDVFGGMLLEKYLVLFLYEESRFKKTII